MDLLAVCTTVATAEQAERLADAAIERKLAACVQAEAIRSTYRWQGAVQHDSEVRLLFKTTVACAPALQALLLERHPYAMPALYALPVTHATEAYARWVADSVAGSSDRSEPAP